MSTLLIYTDETHMELANHHISPCRMYFACEDELLGIEYFQSVSPNDEMARSCQTLAKVLALPGYDFQTIHLHYHKRAYNEFPYFKLLIREKHPTLHVRLFRIRPLNKAGTWIVSSNFICSGYL